ncbi:methyltransferase domain-containing protein [Candidatus Saccharibacteria bacterium]|nr:methyltransferase domain-containing protein [Candidatus Saccharibacteria bacterium]
MSELTYKSLCVLGRQPELGLAELESLYGAGSIRPLESAAVLDIEAETINFKRLGGTIKVARVLAVLPYSNWPQAHKYLVDKVPEHLQYMPEGKFTLGISVHGLSIDVQRLNQDILKLKKVIKSSGRSIRIVPNKALELNSAQVLHNKLTHRGAWELLLVRDGEQIILAQTLFVQDIDDYAARDQARPKRDARVGMLPPKLAQIIINLCNPATGSVVLDPFCGTGVILQEAMLMGHDAVGTDLETKMVEYSKQNIEWLIEKYGLKREVSIAQADATNHKWEAEFGVVASEAYLGRPLVKVPTQQELRDIIQDVNTITKKFLNNLSVQLTVGQRICIALPAWKVGKNEFKHLPVIDHLTDMGYNYLDFKHVRGNSLLYYREDQVVARQLLALQRI